MKVRTSYERICIYSGTVSHKGLIRVLKSPSLCTSNIIIEEFCQTFFIKNLIWRITNQWKMIRKYTILQNYQIGNINCCRRVMHSAKCTISETSLRPKVQQQIFYWGIQVSQARKIKSYIIFRHSDQTGSFSNTHIPTQTNSNTGNQLSWTSCFARLYPSLVKIETL